MKTRINCAAVVVAAATSPAALAQSERSGHHQDASAGVLAKLAEDEIRRVNTEAKKLTIKHGSISDLDKPAVTMVIPVMGPAILDQLKAGGTIKLASENLGGAITLTSIEPAK